VPSESTAKTATLNHEGHGYMIVCLFIYTH